MVRAADVYDKASITRTGDEDTSIPQFEGIDGSYAGSSSSSNLAQPLVHRPVRRPVPSWYMLAPEWAIWSPCPTIATRRASSADSAFGSLSLDKEAGLPISSAADSIQASA